MFSIDQKTLAGGNHSDVPLSVILGGAQPVFKVVAVGAPKAREATCS